MPLLSKSTTTLFGAISRATATKSIFVPASSLHLSSVIYRETVVGKAKQVANDANKGVGKKVGDAIDDAENLTNDVTEKAGQYKDQASLASEQLKDSANNANRRVGEKLGDAIEGAENLDGVKTVENMVEKSKEAIGLGAKKADHKMDEVKDEAKLKTKQAANYMDETKDKATKEVKDKLD
ncbi:MAG: hypothetical protein EXX96DRAFT_480263 [Benjaminiella poitrasii]|nr:MAG: hypothetical protein EXX96DRAFT_480263 [Benjaminiella poitrasii]